MPISLPIQDTLVHKHKSRLPCSPCLQRSIPLDSCEDNNRSRKKKSVNARSYGFIINDSSRKNSRSH